MKKGNYENRKMGICRRKMGPHLILIGAFIRGEKVHLYKGDMSLIRKGKGNM